jgi:hypothetical protein
MAPFLHVAPASSQDYSHFRKPRQSCKLPHKEDMSDPRRTIDAWRRTLGALDNDLIDELIAGRVDRRGFLRHGSMLGLSLPLLGGIATAFGMVDAVWGLPLRPILGQLQLRDPADEL